MIKVLHAVIVMAVFSVAGLVQAEDRLSLLEKNWQLGYAAGNAQQKLKEYVLPGQTVQDWEELATRQIFFDPGARISLDRLVKAIRSGFATDCKNLKWSVLRQTDTAVLYSWSHEGCQRYPAQEERALITRTAAGLCRWAYATKKPPLTDAARAQLDASLPGLSCELP